MATYKFTGESETVFVDVQNPDGSTLQAVPGETYELLTNPENDQLEAIAKAVTTPAPAPTEAPQTAPEAPTAPAN
jgi:hypothetical protein